MPAYQSITRPGPVPGTPQPPEAPSSTGNLGGRPGATPSEPLAKTMQQWREGIFSGQKSKPSGGTMASPPLPQAGGVTVPAAPPPAAPPSASPVVPGQSPTSIPGAQGLIPGTGMPGAAVLPTVPSEQEVQQLPPGSYETPVGTLVKSPDGTSKVVLNPQGQALWQQRTAEAMKAFGKHPFASDPSAPQPPVSPGKLAYNPFSPQGWVGETPPPPEQR